MNIHERNSADMPSIFSYNGNAVTFKTNDGVTYINANEMAKPFPNKEPKHWFENPSTHEYIYALAKHKGIEAKCQKPTSLNTSELAKIYPTLLIVVKGGIPGQVKQGTWMHEDVALEYAQWLSIDFKLWCNDRIKELLLNGVSIAQGSIDLHSEIAHLESELEYDRQQIDRKTVKLETIKELLNKTHANTGYQLEVPKTIDTPPIQQQKLTWQESFIITYEQYIYDNIVNNIDEWLNQGTIPVAEFNSKYRPKGLGVKMYIRAIKRYCIHCNIRFIPHKVVYLTQTGSVRCRIFEK
ncbi:KilA-N domain-containing protein [Sphingobacterium sp. UGAL515B_05]|uniref:KilA-N domain-containing protein n=1 Tax=Sphingobacterium sp. UGAL515B_05 TaxID=2986767 RepID=UPI002953EC0C|nr:KilA-N domain-containing protein [Sphingobacterium sp. UGAL515B_05]WON94773.1 KilA-N domain-containing protein [Sphingobacterium sp. UGAL515B_05]